MRLAGSRQGMASSGARLAASPKRAGKVYGTPEWRAVRAKLIQERGAKCEDCGKACQPDLDHIRELRDGGAAFDERNLRLRCHQCHSQKTQASKRKRVGLA